MNPYGYKEISRQMEKERKTFFRGPPSPQCGLCLGTCLWEFGRGRGLFTVERPADLHCHRAPGDQGYHHQWPVTWVTCTPESRWWAVCFAGVVILSRTPQNGHRHQKPRQLWGTITEQTFRRLVIQLCLILADILEQETDARGKWVISEWRAAFGE